MHDGTQRDSISSQIQDIEMLVSLHLESRTREELIKFVEVLARELLAYRDLLCGTAPAARILGRPRSWVYDAVSRPSNSTQRQVADLVAREGASLVFRVSDLVRLRRNLFEPRPEAISEKDFSAWLSEFAARDRSACYGERMAL